MLPRECSGRNGTKGIYSFFRVYNFKRWFKQTAWHPESCRQFLNHCFKSHKTTTAQPSSFTNRINRVSSEPLGSSCSAAHEWLSFIPLVRVFQAELILSSSVTPVHSEGLGNMLPNVQGREEDYINFWIERLVRSTGYTVSLYTVECTLIVRQRPRKKQLQNSRC
jgi:hypothetical protein